MWRSRRRANLVCLRLSDGSAILKGCFRRPDNVTLALPFSAVIQNMSVDKCVDMCTERVRRRLHFFGGFICARERVVTPDICSRKNPWPSCREIDVTAATRPLSSPSTSRRTRRRASIVVKAKSLRTAATKNTLWCTRHKFRVTTSLRQVSLFHILLLNIPLQGYGAHVQRCMLGNPSLHIVSSI